MEETHKAPMSEPVPPVAFTRERLAEIGDVWVAYAKHQAESYKDKLPNAIKQYLEPKPPPEEPVESSEAAPESGS